MVGRSNLLVSGLELVPSEEAPSEEYQCLGLANLAPSEKRGVHLVGLAPPEDRHFVAEECAPVVGPESVQPE
jgi:hypothetical protein